MVKDQLYRYYLKIFDTSGVPKTDLINGNFTKVVFINGVVSVADAVIITHVSSGVYKVEITPTSVGDYLVDLTGPVAAVPRYFTREDFSTDSSIDELAKETNATANTTTITDQLDDIETKVDGLASGDDLTIEKD